MTHLPQIKRIRINVSEVVLLFLLDRILQFTPYCVVSNVDSKNLFGRGVDYPTEQRDNEESVDDCLLNVGQTAVALPLDNVRFGTTYMAKRKRDVTNEDSPLPYGPSPTWRQGSTLTIHTSDSCRRSYVKKISRPYLTHTKSVHPFPL
jgi:hypothetical protein